MYQSAEPLNKSAHAHLRYRALNEYGFSRALTTAALSVDECEQASYEYPILFSAQGEPLSLLAVLGLNGENVYLDANNHWTGSYVPAYVRRYPFALAQGPEADQFFLAIDRQAPHFSAQDAEALLTAEGELGEPAVKALGFLKVYRESMLKTEAVLNVFASKGILVAQELTVKDGDTTRVIGGFRVVDAKKLYALSDEVLAQWARNGFLQLIYAHWNSLRHLNAVAVASSRPSAVN